MKLELANVVVRFGSGHDALVAVDGVSLGVAEGQTLGIVGVSGCGKSTLARAIVGLAPIHSGKVLLEGDDYTSRRRRQSAKFRRTVQMVFQDPYSSLNPRMNIEEALTEVMPRGTSRGFRRTEARRIGGLVGLAANALSRYPHEFSGGQRQRIAIARALATKASVVITDEVTSSLDVSVQATILNLLKDLQKELRLSYIFISHDLSAIRYMCDTVAVMFLGRIVERAEVQPLLSSPQHPYTSVLIRSIPTFGGLRRMALVSGEIPDPRHPPEGCRFHTLCPIGPTVLPERSVCVEKDPQAIAGMQPTMRHVTSRESVPTEVATRHGLALSGASPLESDL